MPEPAGITLSLYCIHPLIPSVLRQSGCICISGDFEWSLEAITLMLQAEMLG